MSEKWAFSRIFWGKLIADNTIRSLSVKRPLDQLSIRGDLEEEIDRTRGGLGGRWRDPSMKKRLSLHCASDLRAVTAKNPTHRFAIAGWTGDEVFFARCQDFTPWFA